VDVAQYGLACRYGAELYVKQVNSNGGINGKQVELDTQDEKGEAPEAVNVYNKLIEDGVVGIIGDVTSTPTIAVAQASVKDNLPCVTPSATAADVISYGNNYFRACITDPYQGRLMADFAADQGYKTVGVIYNQGGDYEQGVADAFTEEAGKKGITVSDSEGYPAGATDFNSQLTNIIATKPDAIFSPNYYQDDGKIVTQARKLGYTGVFLGADGWSNIVGGDEEYAAPRTSRAATMTAPSSPRTRTRRSRTFIKDYKARVQRRRPPTSAPLATTPP
jgi:branched-chain amino acid transport system substrate-binding protein